MGNGGGGGPYVVSGGGPYVVSGGVSERDCCRFPGVI